MHGRASRTLCCALLDIVSQPRFHLMLVEMQRRCEAWPIACDAARRDVYV